MTLITFTGLVHTKLRTVVVCKPGLTANSTKNGGAFIECRREGMLPPLPPPARSAYSVLLSSPGANL
jgi:hypothetical protein